MKFLPSSLVTAVFFAEKRGTRLEAPEGAGGNVEWNDLAAVAPGVGASALAGVLSQPRKLMQEAMPQSDFVPPDVIRISKSVGHFVRQEPVLLAIAAPSFDAVSETFIRDHTRFLAPGRTVLLCQRSSGSERFGYPVLSHIASPPVRYGNRIADGLLRRCRALLGRSLAPGDNLRVQAFLTEHQPRVLLAQFGPTGVLMMGPCAGAGIPLFVYFRGNDATGLARQPRIRRQYARLFAAATGVIATSGYLSERLAAMGCPREKLNVCPSGVDASRFRVSAREPGRVLCVGRLVEKKAPDQTLRAFAKVRARMPLVHLDLVGDGPLRDLCLRLIDELGLQDAVTFHGRQPPETVATLLGRASVYAQHSVEASNGDCEGTPVGVLEAMASGLPVAASRHSGIGEVVLDGETGFLCNEHDVEGMAEAMERLLADPARAGEMGLAGRRRVEENFTHSHVRQKLLKILGLEELL